MGANNRTVAIFGIGPNVGRAIAIEFVSKAFDHLILLSRDANRLEKDKAAILAAVPSKQVRVDIVPVDLKDPQSVQNALKKIDSLTENIEAVIYNGARVAPSPLFETPVEDVENDFKTTTIGLYLVGGWVLPKLQKLAESSTVAKPSLIVTSGVLHNDPWPSFFSLSVAKTAQRNLVDSFRRVYRTQGVNVGLVCIGGQVSPESKILNPSNLAKETWDFFDNQIAKDKLEVEIYEA